jgi:hypothetical protein
LQSAWPERSVGNPFLDCLPGRLDGFHGLIRPPRRRAHPSGSGYASVQNAYKPSAFSDVKGWRWWWARECDNSLPQAVEAEEGEDELAVGDFVADGGGNPVACGADAALVAGWTEVAALLSFRSLARMRMQGKARRRSWPQSGHWRDSDSERDAPATFSGRFSALSPARRRRRA